MTLNSTFERLLTFGLGLVVNIKNWFSFILVVFYAAWFVFGDLFCHVFVVF